MADLKISELANKAIPTPSDYIVVVDNSTSPGTTKRAPYPSIYKAYRTVGFSEADYIVDGTDDHVQIQAAINAVATAGGGVVFIKAGNYNAATITLKDTVSLQGESRKTHIKGKTNAAPQIIISENFAAVAGTGNAFGGISHGFIDGFTFEGGDQTASSASDYRDMNSVVKLYAWDFRVSNIRIDFAPEIGFYTEHDNDWNDDGTFNTYEFGENTYSNIRIKDYGKVGWVNRGSHDAFGTNIYISSYDVSGLDPDYGYVQQSDSASGKKFGSSGFVAQGLHVWGQHNINAVLIDGSNIIDGFIYAEGCDASGIMLNNSSASRFKAFLGFCTNGIELKTGSNGNDIEAVIESNVSAALFKVDDSCSNNNLTQSPGYSNPGSVVFDLSTGSYTGNHNRFIPWFAFTGTLFSGDPNILDFVDGSNVPDIYRRVHTRAKNTSGGTLAVGDVVIIKAVAAGNEITTTTTAGDKNVYGIVAESIANGSFGYILRLGKTVSLKVDGTTDIAIGDLLSCFTTVKIAKKASTGETVFAKALEAYATDDSSGVLDALLIPPRLI